MLRMNLSLRKSKKGRSEVTERANTGAGRENLCCEAAVHRQPKDTVGARCCLSPYLTQGPRGSHSSHTAHGQNLIQTFDTYC